MYMHSYTVRTTFGPKWRLVNNDEANGVGIVLLRAFEDEL